MTPMLPAISFLGLKGAAAWAAVAAAGLGGVVVVTRALPSLSGGRGATVQRTAVGADAAGGGSVSADLLASFGRSIGETTSRAATAGLGPGASLGAAALGLGERVVETLGRSVDRQTSAMVDTNRELVRANVSSTDRLLDVGEAIVRRTAPTPAAITPRAAAPVAITPRAAAPVAITPRAAAPVAITPVASAPVTPSPAYAPPPPPVAQYYPTSAALATAVRGAAAGVASGTRIKLVTGEWITV